MSENEARRVRGVPGVTSAGAAGSRGPLELAQEAMTARRVFGEPYEQEGAVVIPAARVSGGGGGGGGPTGGGGFGLSASPAGAFVIRNGEVRWRPAIDVNRIVLGCQIVAIVLLLTIRARVRASATHR